ncbi:MAG: hypothetical protein GX601_08450, partial [Anaerolineales bacterium]|nr:hypothetical protein [Anaerolineales bacterium]
HLTYALLLCLATYALGKRTLGATAGWIAAAVLVGIPLFPLWASFAYADMAWTAYELLALMALLRWRESQQSRWIVAAGLGTGLALGSKYLALGGAAVFGLWLLWHSRARGPRAVLVNAALFGGIALAIASPWYLKNWALGGNPVYPAYFGGLGWTEERLTYYTQYHDSFGVGHRLIDYLLLPWNLYAHHERFGTFQGSAEIPSLLFPIALFWPFIRRPAAIKGLGFIALGRFVFWALGSQQTRFLLPLFPILGLMVAAVLLDVGRRPWGRLLGRVLPAGLAGGMLFATLLYSIIFCTQMWPIPVIVGAESADAYLRRIASDYPGIRFVMTELPEDARVLMMWDGQGYYCDSRCWPDPENSRWTRYVQAAESTGALADRLRGEGVTHLFFSRGDIGFMALHDPSGQHVAALRFFWSEFSGRHTRRVFSDEWVGVYELVSR